MNPQNYARDMSYRPPARWYRRLNNTLGVLLTSRGLAPRDAVTLEVRGRKSGRPRRIPILRTPYQGRHYLVSLSGESDWVRNVRAADGQAIVRRRKAHPVHLEEVPPAYRAEVLLEYHRQGRERSGLRAGEKQARFYFGVPPEPSLQDFRKVAARYPVFRIIEGNNPVRSGAVRPSRSRNHALPPSPSRRQHGKKPTEKEASYGTDRTGTR